MCSSSMRQHGSGRKAPCVVGFRNPLEETSSAGWLFRCRGVPHPCTGGSFKLRGTREPPGGEVGSAALPGSQYTDYLELKFRVRGQDLFAFDVEGQGPARWRCSPENVARGGAFPDSMRPRAPAGSVPDRGESGAAVPHRASAPEASREVDALSDAQLALQLPTSPEQTWPQVAHGRRPTIRRLLRQRSDPAQSPGLADARLLPLATRFDAIRAPCDRRERDLRAPTEGHRPTRERPNGPFQNAHLASRYASPKSAPPSRVSSRRTERSCGVIVF